MKLCVGWFCLPVIALSLIPVFLAGCSSDLAVPAEAQLGCQSAADCPSGWACNEKVSRCVKTENIDSTAPALAGEVKVAPTVLKKGAKAAVAFSVSEELSKPPVVTVNAGTDRLLSLDEKASEVTRYVFTYTAAGDEPQGVESPISIVLTDKSGNESGKLSGGLLKFDFIAPSIPADKVFLTGSPAKKDGVVTVKFTVSEPLAAAPVVSLALAPDPLPLVLDPSSAGQDYVYTYAATGGESEDAAGIGLTVDLADAAGNTANVALEKIVLFDFIVPALVGVPTVTPAVARKGSMVTVGFEASETLTKAPVVTAGGVELTGKGAGRSYEYGYKVADDDADGERAVTITLEDDAGNALVDAPGGAFTIDSTKPSITNVSTDRARYSAAAGFNTATLTFDASEDVGAGLVVTVGGVPMSCGAWQSANPSHMCTYTVLGNEGEGVKEVSIAAVDAAGNAAYGSRTVELDFSGPTLQLSVQPNGRPARLGEIVTVGVAASEALNPAGISLDSGTLALGAPTGSGTSYSWTYTVKATDSGVFNLSAAAPATGTIALDGVVPVVSDVAADKERYSRVVGYDTVKVTFDCTEDVGAGLNVKVGGATMTCGAWSATSPNYACTYAVQAGDTGGVKPFEVKATDAAGNSAYGSGSVEYDFTNPIVLGAGPGKGAYRSGESLLYTVSVSEGLAGTPGRPAVRVFKGGVEQVGFFGTPVSETDTNFTYTRPAGGMTDGTYTVLVDVTDRAGNAVANAGSPTGWSIDATAPVVTYVSLSSNNPYDTTLAKSAELVTAVFDVNEVLASDPTVNIGGWMMSLDTKTGTVPCRYTYTRPLSGGETDGQKTTTVTATDLSGNVTVRDIGSLTFDFLAPSVVANSDSIQLVPFSGSLLPTVTNVAMNSAARVSFSASELLLADPTVTVNPSAGTWGISKYSSAGNSYIYDIKLTGGSPTQGTTEVRVSMTDKAGTPSGMLTLAPTFTVDTVAPTPISVAQNDKMLYRRIPWGSDATLGVKKFTVETLAGQTGAVETNAWVIFWDAANIATASEIGRTKADGSGFFAQKDLNRADRATVYLSQVDEAGNIDSATATEIKNQDWTATMGYKVPGSTFENPHKYETRSWFVGSLAQTGFAEAGASDGLGAISPPLLEQQGGGAWRQRTFDDPSARYWHALAFDSARGKVVLFGGWTGIFNGETWEWDGASWARKTPTDPEGDGNPSARSRHALAYDSARGKVVMFGGNTGGYNGETWEWDGASWARKTPTDPEGDGNPSARSRHALVYDSARGMVDLFGGFTGAYNDETWEWDRGVFSRPGQFMQVVFTAAGALSAKTIESVSAIFYSGAVGYPAGVAANGTDLKVWDEGMWKVAATSGSPPGAPSLVSWTTTDSQVISRLFFGAQQTLNFAVTPVAPNGTGTGEVSVDYAEVTVKCRIP
ncbi:MAG: hypothetical protein HY897_23375 [Deltaproteobacteria bacterium]|nr:hypothetical protein [Deltaproteobacteria bacterium]